MPRKKVLIFSLAYFPKHVGGAEVAVKEITDRIPDIEFHMVCLQLDSALTREEKIGNVLVHRVGFGNTSLLNKFLFQFLAAWKALMLHRTAHFDAIWAVMAHSCGVPAALFKLFHRDVPYVLTLQEGDPSEHIERMMLPLWPLFSRAFTSADTVTGISTFLGKWARRRGFMGPFELVPNAADTARFSQIYPDAVVNEIKDQLGKKMGDVFLITTSRLVHKNAVDVCIRALPHLPGNVHFLVLGIGPDEEMLKKLAAELNVSGRVQFLGHVSHENMP